MKDPDTFKESRLKRLQLYFYLVPVVGALPALWTLYRQGKTRSRSTDATERDRLSVSRLSATLALAWIASYALLWTGAANTSELLKFRLLFLDSLLTSGYFLVCFGLMFRLWRRKSLRLPFASRIAEQTLRSRE